MRFDRFTSVLFVSVLAGCGASGVVPSEDQPFDPALPVDHAPVPAGPAVPEISTVWPSLASPAMTLRVSGAGFGADPAAVTVTFGGVPAVPVSVSDAEILVHPVAGGTVDAEGATEVRVSVNGVESNAASMHIGTRGDIDRIETAPPQSVGDVVSLADGSIVVTDPIGARVYRVDTQGVVRPVAPPAGGFGEPARVAAVPDGSVLVFDAVESTIWKLGSDDAVSPWRAATPGWTNGVWMDGELFVLGQDATTIERLDASGVVTGFLPLSSCAGANTIATLDGVIYVGAGWVMCSVDPATGAETEIAFSGEMVWDLASLRGANGSLLAAGTFASGPGVATIDASGAVALAVPDPRGYPTAAAATATGETLVGLSDGNLARVGASGFRLVAAPVHELGDFRRAGDRYLATAGLDIPFLAEVWTDGAYRILATGDSPAMWTRVATDGDDFLVAAYDAGLVLRVSADGSVSTAVDHTALGPVASFVQLQDGFLVSSYGPDIARYDAAGALVDAQYVHADGATTFGLALTGSTVFAAAGDRLLEADVLEGGAASSRLIEGTTGLLAVTTDAHGAIYVADGNDTGRILQVTAGGTSPVGSAGAPISLAVDADGAILVSDLYDVPYRMLP